MKRTGLILLMSCALLQLGGCRDHTETITVDATVSDAKDGNTDVQNNGGAAGSGAAGGAAGEAGAGGAGGSAMGGAGAGGSA